MNELVTLITCTGSRPEAFALCKKYFSEQTFKGKTQWIIIDDSHTMPLVNEGGIEVYHGPVKWEPNINTHRANMLLALTKIKGDIIIILEDDDAVKPEYIETMVSLLKYVDVVGEGNAKYFNLQVPGFKEMHNTAHASLCQTALRKSALPLLKNAIDSGELYFDIHFWRAVREKKVSNIILNEKNLCVGIKGMPGRVGIGVGHNTNAGYLYDGSLSKLEEWAGKAAADMYRPYIKKYERKVPNAIDAKGKQGNASNAKTVQVKAQSGGSVLRNDK